MAVGVRKAVNEQLHVSKGNGGGIVRREIWVDGQDIIVRYNLAYINPLIYSGDNGPVVGYDSAHGHHHRHYKGKISVVSLSRFEDIEAQFQGEWSRLAKEAKYAKD